MPAPLSAWNLYGDPRLVTIGRVNIPNFSFSKCDMSPISGVWRKAKFIKTLSLREADPTLADPTGYRISEKVASNVIAECETNGEVFLNPTKLALTTICQGGYHCLS